MSSEVENAFVNKAVSNLQAYVDSLPERRGQQTTMQKSMANNLIKWLQKHRSMDFAEVQKPMLGEYIKAYTIYKESIQQVDSDQFSNLLAELYTGAYRLSEDEPAFKEAGRKMK